MSKALVLGGGGPVGVAWEAGLLAGLAEAGVDLSAADRIVGTSAGSIVGAHLARGDTPGDLFTASGSVSSPEGRAPAVDAEALMAIGSAIFEGITGARPHEEIVRELGQRALAAATITEEEFATVVSPSLGPDWPDRDFACTAYDVDSGAFVAWDAASGAPFGRAVTSSCAVPGIFPPITIGGRRYMDGGVISGTNAGLAEGHDRVVIVSVISRVVPGAEEFMRGPLDLEINALRAAGAEVELIEFDDASQAAAGGNLMAFTPDVVGVVGAAGVDQGRAEAERIGALWG
ncbi:MAG: patatin-like phospholipase family protein [Acidimicrobiales bacterium]